MAIKLRAIRITDELWLAAQEAARIEGISLSQIMRDALISYVETNSKQITTPANKKIFHNSAVVIPENLYTTK